MVHNKKEKAILLRKSGHTYSEILRKVPVAKSTLSLWLRSVNLSKQQVQKITKKRKEGIKKGWEVIREKRIVKTKIIKEISEKEIKKINKKEFWLLGICLYWAEGTKEKDYRTGERVAFSNSDPEMIVFFLKWLRKICLIKNQDIIYELCLHKNKELKKIKKYWIHKLSIDKNLLRVYFKKDTNSNYRKNKGSEYKGLMKIKVKKSTDLNRKIAGWISGLYKNCGIV